MICVSRLFWCAWNEIGIVGNEMMLTRMQDKHTRRGRGHSNRLVSSLISSPAISITKSIYLVQQQHVHVRRDVRHFKLQPRLPPLLICMGMR